MIKAASGAESWSSSTLLPLQIWYITHLADDGWTEVFSLRTPINRGYLSMESLAAEVRQELERVQNDPSVTLDTRLLDKFGLEVGGGYMLHLLIFGEKSTNLLADISFRKPFRERSRCAC